MADEKVRLLVEKERRRTRRLQAANAKKGKLIQRMHQASAKLVRAMDVVRSRVSPRFHQLLDSEFRNRGISPRGRRWTVDEKLSALGWYHRGRNLYNYLRNSYMALPSSATLRMFVGRADLRPGINVHLCRALKRRLQRTPSKDVVFMWDEVSLRKELVHRRKEDRIVGFADYGTGERPNKVASHAWIGMVKGLFENYKFPVVYHLTAGDEDGVETAELVKGIISALQDIGFRIRASVCDGPPKHLAALRHLGATPEDPTFTINGEKIFAFIDPPHLVKAVRNNLLTHILCLGDKEVKFEYVRTFAEKDKTFPARLAPKLTDTHVAPKTSKQKMDCGRAYQTLSSSVAAGLYAFSSFHQLPREAEHTAAFFHDMDLLADSFNGSTVPDPNKPSLKPHKVALSQGSPHKAHWSHMKNVFKDLTFRRISNSHVVRKLPFQDSWTLSMNAAEKLWEAVEAEGQPFLPTKALNQVRK